MTYLECFNEMRRGKFMEKQQKINSVRYGLLALSIVLILIGVKSGEMYAVLQKAIRICLECIGIG